MSANHTISQVLPNGTLLDGIYEIEELLGSGGFGKTYRVFDRQLERRLAVKEFFPTETAMRSGQEVRPIAETKRGAFEKGLASFSQEARHLASVTHPNIVKVFRSFDANGTSYIILDYVEGIDLEDWLSNLGAAPTQAELDRLTDALLSAMELIHGAQILHRDIAPKNIRIRIRDGSPILLDFGLAKSIVPQASVQSSAVIVAHGYAPTESYATGTKLQGPWTDIYGLAAVLYRALTGASPPTAPERLFDDQIVPAVSLPNSSRYRKSFLDGIDWGLSINPADRPQTVADWRATLIDGRARAKRSDKLSPGQDLAATTIVPVADLKGTRSDDAKSRRQLSYGLIATVLLIVGGVTLSSVTRAPQNSTGFIAPSESAGGKGGAGVGPNGQAARTAALPQPMEGEKPSLVREKDRAEPDSKAAADAKDKQASLDNTPPKDAAKEPTPSLAPQPPSEEPPAKQPAEEQPKAGEEQKGAAPEETQEAIRGAKTTAQMEEENRQPCNGRDREAKAKARMALPEARASSTGKGRGKAKAGKGCGAGAS